MLKIKNPLLDLGGCSKTEGWKGRQSGKRGVGQADMGNALAGGDEQKD